MKSKKIFSWIIAATVIFSNFTIIPHTDDITYAATTDDEDGNFLLKGDTLTIKNDSDIIDLQICENNILRVDYKPGGQEDPNTEVLDSNQKWGNGKIIKSDLKSDPAIIETEDIIVKINKSDLSISVYDSSNGLLVKQDSISDAKNVSFTHNSGENFYGISGYGCGTSADDGALRNNNTYEVTCASQGWAGGPFVWSTGGYGILVDSDGGKITTGDTSLSYNGISKTDAEYFIIAGDPETISKGVSEISGSSPMYPKWAMGFTNTQWGWPGSGTVEDQAKKVIETYRDKKIPIDNFCFDFDWKYWGYPEMDNGEFNWNLDSFPSAKDGVLKKWTEDNGIHFTGIIKPRIFTGKDANRETSQFKEATEKGFVSSTAQKGSDYCAGKDYVSIDYSTQAARDWWWSKYETAFDEGLSGFWNDEIDHDNGYKNFGDFNAQRALYEGQRKYTDDQTRVWSINRNFYLGAQRYSYGIWTGDISTGFSNMKGQAGKLIAAVNLGENKWGMDTGGFNGGDPSPENYARWIEFSALTPIFRVHGQDCRSKEQAPKTGTSAKPRYPWNFGETAEAAAKNAMQMRYRLVPYIYKYEHDASEGGTGIVKTLMMQYPNDPNVSKEMYSWMFGDYMLVSPVLDEGITEKEVYLPSGNKWIDKATGTEYEGGQTVKLKTDATTWKDIPIFIKEGAIIPSQKDINSIAKDTASVDTVNLNVFPSAKSSSFEYYDDDGETYDYEKDSNVFKQNLTVAPNKDGDGITFKTAEKEGNYDTPVKSYVVKLHVKNPGNVTLNGKSLSDSKGTIEGLKDNSYTTVNDPIYGKTVCVKVESGEVNTIDVKCDIPEAPEQSAKVYAKTSAGSADYEYSTDNGETWEKGDAMKQSSNAGYLEADFKYKLSSAENVKFRYKVDNKYYPSEDGVELSNEKSNFTIGKDGKVKNGTPSTTKANIYIGSDSNTPIIQYKDDTGWSDYIPLDAYGTQGGQFNKTVSYDSDCSDITMRYSVDNGKTWLPSEEGTKVTSGDFMADSDKLVAGKPAWNTIVTIYYKPSNPAINKVHWRPLGAPENAWDPSPYTNMKQDENGYYKVTLNAKDAEGVEVCFTGGGIWDNGGGEGKNYKVTSAIATIEGGTVSAGAPDGSGNDTPSSDVITISSSIKGNTYSEAQTLKLSSSNSSAKIYYTTDGSEPTQDSTEYSEPIKISQTTTVKSIAVSGSSKSPINTQEYIIDGSVDPKPPVDPGYDKLNTVNINADETSVKEGNSIELTASCNTKDPTVEYEFGYYDENNEYHELQAYSNETTCTFENPKIGTYNVVAKAKSEDVSERESNSVKVTVTKADNTKYDKLNSAKASVDCNNIELGNKVQITASCNTDDPTVKYEFGYYDQNDKYTVIKDFSSDKTFKWQPEKEGQFDIVVKAKSDTVNDPIESESTIVKVTTQPVEKKLTEVHLDGDKSSVKVGEKVLFTATVDYNDSVTYQFGYYDKDNNWKTLRSAKESNTFEWTPEQEGTYEVAVRAIPNGDTSKRVESERSSIKVSKDGNNNNPTNSGDSRSVAAIIMMTMASCIGALAVKKRKSN